MTTFARRLKDLRESKNISQQELADDLKVAKSTISMYEQGKRQPNFELQEALADYFNVDIDYLVGRSDRTTVVTPAIDNQPKRRYLMDKIAKATPEQLEKLDKLWNIISNEDEHDI